MGEDRAPSNFVFVKLRGRKMEGAERAVVATKLGCFGDIKP